MASPVRLLMVEDSPTMAFYLRGLLEECGFQVVAVATTLREAEELFEREQPRLVLSDIRLPGGNGIELTRRLLQKRGVPIVLITAYDPRNPALVFEAMEAGALDVLPKPPARSDPGFRGYRKDLERTLRVLAGTPVIRRHAVRPSAPAPLAEPPAPPPSHRPQFDLPIVAIGASTGGPPVIADLLRALRGRRLAFAVVAQHIMAEFAESFRGWLAELADRPVLMATSGEVPRAGAIYTVPAHAHLRWRRQGRWDVVPSATLPLAHVPSVDVLFQSLAEGGAPETLAVLLTGMGADGAVGLEALRKAGAWTVAQRPDTATVDSMPRAAIDRGAAREVLAPEEMVALLRGLKGA